MRAFVISMATVTAGGIVLYTIWVIPQSYDPGLEAILSSAWMILLSLLTAALGVYIAISKASLISVRRTWLLIGLAALSNAIAEGLWMYYESILHVDPFPSLADLFYLLFYPLMLAGILSLPFLPVEHERRALIGLDMSILMVLGGLFLWYFILAPIQFSGESGLTGLVALAYPVADLFILAGLLSLIQRDLENVGRMVLIALSASMLFTGAADVLFAILETYSVPYTMPPMNILWMISYWTILFAAVWQILYPAAKAGEIEAFRPLLRNTLLYVAPVLAIGLALTSAVALFGSNQRLYGTFVGAFALAVLVLLRQYVVLRENRRLFKRMEQFAVTDALTGLYNRHYFNEAITREIKRAQRYGRTLSLLLMDVDNFKDFNDAFGHLQGDVVLKQVASFLKSQVRSTDLLARFGGDEFVAILPETHIIAAQKVAEKIRRNIGSRFMKERLGMSIGIAIFRSGMSVQSLLAEADRNLYHAKPAKI